MNKSPRALALIALVHVLIFQPSPRQHGSDSTAAKFGWEVNQDAFNRAFSAVAGSFIGMK